VSAEARCTGAILAGGRGSRMGGARKGLLPVGGRRIVDRVADALAAAADELLLVAADPDAAAWLPGVRVAADLRPGNGSMGGVHAALAGAPGGVLVLAWDMPFVSAALLRALRETGERERRGADAVVPRVSRAAAPPRAEPLCAYYAPSCLTTVERRLDAGDRRLTALLGELRVRYVDDAELAAHGDPDVLFANVNTPDDLARAAARAGSGA